MTPKVQFFGSRAVMSFGAQSMPPLVSALADALPNVPAVGVPVVAGSGWAGHYHIETRGKSDDEILAEINRVQIYHDKKSARLTGFQALIGASFVADGIAFRIAHVSISERGTNVELYASAIGSDNSRPKPVTKVYTTVDDVPTDQQIINIVRDSILSERLGASTEAAKTARLQTLLGG